MTVTKADPLEVCRSVLLASGVSYDKVEEQALAMVAALHREDAERPLLERIEKLEAALSLAANRLHRRAVDFGTGTGLFFETCDWADEARQALGETQ